ncbi:GrpB-like predicted nucleotidyltransferase (UPF0157 family) [Desulfosalsimonas propionicica]|uniref:GrpB-like predicted nucleotidyltransferase (UPF0157 family) n=1 Tax=Desulfosalsimonas propionicica TaxID=332175 RepID=A0A7W0CCK0_9BACT|nr:transposase [Desulfosalsimonas propionicica]MBA2883273.1 GrpB-like predicted nucleotidyltransferase (UPF0157 family) [Desulfosalsimonas propionicica]
MKHTQNTLENQTVSTEKLGILANIFSEFKIGSLLNAAGITKTKGAGPLAIFTVVFNLSFTGKNFFQSVVKDQSIRVGKDAVYNFLNSPVYNWRRFTLLLAVKIHLLIRSLLDKPSKEEVLIFDDSLYSRNRSKKVELLSRVFDHNSRKYLKGFRLLTLGWSDGNSFLGLDFALLSSPNERNRYNGITKSLDKRTCGYRRRQEAITKSTDLLEPMVKRALNAGIRAKYLLMDSWFSAPSIVSSLRQHMGIICMLKDHPNWRYEYKGQKLRLRDLYGKLSKKRGKARVKASVVVKMPDGKDARVIFVPGDKKRGWLALLCTDTAIADEEIIRLYGKRWDIEVFFKMCKQHLNMVKEIQLRDFDGLIGHTSMVFARYNILTWFQRQQVDHRSFGDLFRTCNKELENLKFIDALQRIIQMAKALIQKTGAMSKKAVQAIMDAVMGAAIIFFGFSSDKSSLISEV